MGRQMRGEPSDYKARLTLREERKERKTGWKHLPYQCSPKGSWTRLFEISQSPVRGVWYLPGMHIP